MSQVKIESNKKYLYMMIIVFIFVLIFFIVYKNFNFFTKEEVFETNSSELPQTELKKKGKIEALDLSILDDPKFVNLKEYRVEAKNINELKIGKDNPFLAE